MRYENSLQLATHTSMLSSLPFRRPVRTVIYCKRTTFVHKLRRPAKACRIMNATLPENFGISFSAEIGLSGLILEFERLSVQRSFLETESNLGFHTLKGTFPRRLCHLVSA